VRALAGCALDTGGARVKLDGAADEVDRGVLPLGEDGEALVIDLDRGLLDEASVTEFLKSG